MTDTGDDPPEQPKRPSLKELLLAPTPRCELEIPPRGRYRLRKTWTGAEPFDDEPSEPE